jgi:hypothetical protein
MPMTLTNTTLEMTGAFHFCTFLYIFDVDVLCDNADDLSNSDDLFVIAIVG